MNPVVLNVVLVYAAINVVAYLFMWYDKRQAIRNGRRIRESSLWIMALLFGASGIYLGTMAPLYHKASRTGFTTGVFVLLILQNVFFGYVIKYILREGLSTWL